MSLEDELQRRGLTSWLADDGSWMAFEAGTEVSAEKATVVTVESLQSALAGLEGVRVVSAVINASGDFDPPQPPSEMLPPGVDLLSIRGVPAFWDVRVSKHGTDGHVTDFYIWVPLAWNRRFLATVGGGSMTGPLWADEVTLRNATMSHALRNGFATAATDGANKEAATDSNRLFDWPLDSASGALDRELIRNWNHLSTHEMTVVAKRIISAIHGREPEFSYLAGGSGGGRQAIASAIRWPTDFDGVWAADPAVNWTRIVPAGLWPALIMKHHQNPVAAAKLDAVREAVIEACDGIDGLRDGFLGALDPIDFDLASMVGVQTSAGPITQRDVEVVGLIWDGPRRRDGRRLWYGLRPGVASWGPLELCHTTEIDGTLRAVPWPLGLAHLQWVSRDRQLDWDSLTLETYESLFDEGVRDLAAIATDDPDLTSFMDAGAKLLLTQAGEDQALPMDGCLDYYERIVETMGGLDQTMTFARLFVADGDSHTFCTGHGPGVSLAEGMSALMRWVESGETPTELVAERYDTASGRIDATRPVYPYPQVTRYSGVGDPSLASSYHAADRQLTVAGSAVAGSMWSQDKAERDEPSTLPGRATSTVDA
ncbi:MAG: tannase/feruloyl esterase family alpha/beta hydrolase [Nocardioides sp.]|uniref:tannase/feruloyl esterase family alpha/beta hydrolase n=1 Tax=Nocardioides sp. TaxID=35761 RepID=UPI0039E52658